MLFFSTATSAGKAAKRRGADETRVGKERRAEPRGGEETRVGEQRRGEERRAGPERGFEDRRWSWSGPEVARKGGDTCCSQLPIGALSHRSLYPTVSTAPLTPTTHPNTSAPTLVRINTKHKYAPERRHTSAHQASADPVAPPGDNVNSETSDGTSISHGCWSLPRLSITGRTQVTCVKNARARTPSAAGACN